MDHPFGLGPSIDIIPTDKPGRCVGDGLKALELPWIAHRRQVAV
jgi:hypothetical protein